MSQMIQDNQNCLKEILKRILSNNKKSKENNNRTKNKKNLIKTKIINNKISLDKEESYKANKINKTNN